MSRTNGKAGLDEWQPGVPMGLTASRYPGPENTWIALTGTIPQEATGKQYVIQVNTKQGASTKFDQFVINVAGPDH